MVEKFRVVPKVDQNLLCVFLVYPNGGYKEIARVVFPNDFQMNDNVECAEAICVAIRKRIKKSV